MFRIIQRRREYTRAAKVIQRLPVTPGKWAEVMAEEKLRGHPHRRVWYSRKLRAE